MANSDGQVRIEVVSNFDEVAKSADNCEKKVNNFNVSGLENSFNALDKSLNDLSAQFANFTRPVQQDDNALKELENTVKAQYEQIEKLQQGYNDLAGQLNALKNPIDENAKKLNNLGQSYNTAFLAQEKLFRATNVTKSFHDTSSAVGEAVQRMKELAYQGNTNSQEFKNLTQYVNEANAKIKEANSVVDKATGGFSKQSNGMQSLISMGKTLIGGYVGIQGAIKAFNFSMESVEAYRTQERAINSLNISLKNAGVYTDEYSTHLQQLASDIQSYSNYGDEAIIKAQAVAQAFMGAVPITDELTKAVVDFAAAMDMDLEQAFTLVSKSIGSNTNALSRYGVELGKGMTESEKMSAIVKQLGDRYKGQAAQMADANTQLKNSIGDLKEAFGSALNGYVSNWQNGMRTMVQATTKFINSIRVMRADLAGLNMQELTTRYQKNMEVISRMEGQKDYSSGSGLQMKTARMADQKAILYQMKALRDQAKNTPKVTPIKISDVGGGGVSSGSSSRGGHSSGGGGTAKSAGAIKDAFEQAQQQAQQAEKAFKLALYQSGGNITPNVLAAKQKFEETKTTVENVQKAFDNMTASSKSNFEQLNYNLQQSREKLQELASADVVDLEAVRQAQLEYQKWQEQLTTVNSYFEKPKTRVQELNTEIQKTTELLQQLYFEKGVNSEEFINAKNQLKEYQTELQNMNTAVTGSFGVNWKNVTDSIRANLVSAIVTPLQEGETYFQRFANFGLSVLNTIATEILNAAIKKLFTKQQEAAMDSAALGIKSTELGIETAITGQKMQQLTLQQAINASIAAGKAAGGVTSLFGSANGNVFQNGNVIPFAKGGVVDKPTIFPMANGGTGLMGEAGAEAVMPLRRMSNGRLGVEAENTSGNGNSTAVNVNIYNQSGASVETRRRDDGSMDVFIRKVNEALASERTSSGFRSAYSREDTKGVQAV